MGGLMAVAAVTVLYIVLNQAYTHTIKPWGVSAGVDAGNASLIEIAWFMWPIPVVLAYVISIIHGSVRDRRIPYP